MKILWYLNDSEKSVNDLVSYTNIKQTTLSQHLSLLKDRELVESRREGSYVFYRLLNPKVMEVFAMTHDMYCETQQPRHEPESESSFHSHSKGFAQQHA
jgi:DNA-binding transcriptional ArsR family regulator